MNYPAALSRSLHQGYVQCTACEHWCAVAPGEAGKCGVRRNEHGALQLVVYGTAVAVNVDPVEKKPLHHFFPGREILSYGTVGCNLTCQWCQNWEISQQKFFDPDLDFIGEEWPPQALVATCQRQGISLLAFTYNEPAVYIEYAYDTARLAHSSGIRTALVSSGFETVQALDKLIPYLDAANIDLKSFSDDTYRHYCDGRLEPILRNIRHLVEKGIWTEVTTLVVPGLNDSDEELGAIAAFLASVSPDIPWHVSGFAPHYQMRERPATTSEGLHRAWEIGHSVGLRYVYTGNIWGNAQLSGCSHTYCPDCGATLVERAGYHVHQHWKQPGICHRCGAEIAGRWRW